MDKNQLTLGAAANFEDCLKVIRVNTDTGSLSTLTKIKIF